MKRPPEPLPASLPWRVFTRAQALEAGLPVERLRRTDLRRLRTGLYARTSSELVELDLASAFCRSIPDAVVVGLSAARLQGLPLPRDLESWEEGVPVEIAVPHGRKGADGVVRWRDFALGPRDIRRASGVVPAAGQGEQNTEDRAPGELGPAEQTPHDRLVLPVRITPRARTWRDLAAELTHYRLVALGDHLVRRPRPSLEQGRTQPWCTLDALRAQCTGRYAAALRQALADVRIGADSPRETLLRLAFARAGLPEPQINVPLIGDDGRARHEPDFQWPRYWVAAEYEGKGHNDPAQVKRDIARARRVRSAGWTEVRLHDEDTHDGCAGAIQQVRMELAAKGWRP